MSSNITVNDVKDFVKNNVTICALILVNLVCFIMANSYGNAKGRYSNQLDQEQLKVKKLETELDNLKTISADIEALSKSEEAIWEKCLNFGKKTSLYKFVNKVHAFLDENEEHDFVANLTSAYDLTKKQPISMDQDVSDLHGDYVLGEYTMNFKGNFAQLLSFMKKIQEMEYYIQLKQIDLKALNTEDLEELTISLIYQILGKIKIKEAKETNE